MELNSIKLRYSESLIREAVRSYWIKHVGLGFPVATLLLSLILVFQIIEGDRTWVIGVLGSVVFMAFVIMVASYYVHLHRSLKRFKMMKSPDATLELDAEKFRVKSDMGSSEFQWALISQVWRLEKVWLLFFSAGEFMTLPIEGMSAESKSFIISKLEANGAKII